MLYFPELVRHGDVPNVDFLHLYGPGSLHALDGLVRRVRTLAGGRAHLRALAAPRHHLRVVRAGPRVGSAGRHRRCRVRRVLRHDADRADRHGLERGARAHPVERGVRGPRAPPARRSPTAEMLARGRRAGRIGADLPARPDRRPRPRLRVAPLAVSGHPASGRARRRRRVHPDVGPPGDGRPRRGVPGHGAGPGVRAPGRAGAAPPAVVQPARRRVAGGGRGDPTVVAPPPPAGVSCLVLLVLRHAARHLRAGGVRRLAAPAAGRRDRPLDRPAGGGPRQPRHPPPGAAAAGLGPPELGDVRVLAFRSGRRDRGGATVAAADRLAGGARSRCRP